MEIRIGIVDVQSIFGIRSIRVQKRIEVRAACACGAGRRVRPERPRPAEGRVLGVEIPFVPIPIVPGKNITVIVEVVALNYLAQAYGYSPAEKQHLLEMMSGRADRAWVREDMR